MSDRKDTCASCRYWDNNAARGGVSTTGLCRRRAPAPRILKEKDDRMRAAPVWPETGSAEWCGEYQSYPVPQKYEVTE